ncbi:protein krueppel [Podospora fimiseda]|uniref:Protein krueppel n=1 Tax=Podospora fimiseda TaxID=252190 RepID=A0AAN7BWS0_9PEZI|nr:protein krueppel [Podospora fimiseda]
MPDTIAPPPPPNGTIHSSQSPGGQSYYASHGSWQTPASSQQQTYPYTTQLPHRSYSTGLASPASLHYPRSSPNAPNGDNMSNHSYQDQQQSYPSPVHGGSNGTAGGGGVGGTPILPSSQPSGLVQPIMNGSAPQGPQHPSHSSGQSPETAYTQRPNMASPVYTTSSTPHQSSFPAYVHNRPQQSPTSTSPTGTVASLPPRVSSNAPGLPPTHYQQQPSQRPQHGHPMGSYPQYSSVPGPVLSNLHQPGGGLAIVNNHHHYGVPYQHNVFIPHGHHGGHPHHQDRPFKCDECNQSFNRNHDLKRHKRIHLAVKPFPCTYCDKSFSRKDALKRHRLVKGCGDKGKRKSDSQEPRDDDNCDRTPPGDATVVPNGTI